MELDPKIAKNIGAFVGAFLSILVLFGSAWLYVDTQRVRAFELREEAARLKAEADAKEKFIKQRQEEDASRNNRMAAELSSRQAQITKTSLVLSEKERRLNVDAQLSRLATTYLDESAAVDRSRTCGDDEAHNARVRKAEATLDLILSIAQQQRREEYVGFVNAQRRSHLHSWEAACNQ